MDTKRVLFISGSMGLGHAGRDLAIAAALRDANPAVRISWLAGDPARRMIAGAGETLLPETQAYGNETAVAEDISAGFSLNITRFAWSAQRAWEQNMATFLEVTQRYSFDLVVGDETYETAGTFRKHPDLKRIPFALIYDFVGLERASLNPQEWIRVRRANRSWCGGRRGAPPVEDLVLMIGEPADVPDRRFGFLLPNRRQYALRHYAFVGYIVDFDPAALADRSALRAALGYDDRPLIVCSIGGSAVGRELLELCAAAYPAIAKRAGEVRMVLVTGPRLDPETIRVPHGVEVRGYVPRLFEHFAASDLAIVQGGGTTTLELTALRRPFVYFPLEGQFEQEGVVADRLARHGAGERLRYPKTTPERLAETAIRLLGSEPTWPPVPTDGARRSAELIKKLL